MIWSGQLDFEIWKSKSRIQYICEHSNTIEHASTKLHSFQMRWKNKIRRAWMEFEWKYWLVVSSKTNVFWRRTSNGLYWSWWNNYWKRWIMEHHTSKTKWFYWWTWLFRWSKCKFILKLRFLNYFNQLSSMQIFVQRKNIHRQVQTYEDSNQTGLLQKTIGWYKNIQSSRYFLLMYSLYCIAYTL